MVRMSKSEYALHAKVSRPTISGWLKSGRIVEEPDGRIDVEKADAMRAITESQEPHHQARKAQIDEEKESDNRSAAQQLPDTLKLVAATKLENYKERKAKVELLHIELDKQAKLLVEREDVNSLLATIGTHIRTTLDGVPALLTPVIVSCHNDRDKIYHELTLQMDEALHTIANHVKSAVSEF